MDSTAVSPRVIRLGLIALMVAAAVAGVTGITQDLVFHQPTELKYAVTIAGPLLLLSALTLDEPLHALMPMVIVAAPFAAFVVTLHGVQVSGFAILLFLAAAVAIVTSDPSERMSHTAVAAAIAIPLLAVALVTGSGGRSIATVLVAMLVTGWLVSRTARSERGLMVILYAVVVACSIQALLAIWEFESGHLLNLYGSAGNQVFGSDYFFSYGTTNRPTGSFFDPISLGNVLSLACPIALSLVVAARSLTARLLSAGAAILIGVGLALSLSRESWIGAAAGLLVCIVCLPPAARRIAIAPTLAAAAIVVALALGSGGSALGERFDSILHPTATGVRTAQGDRQRIDDWDVALHTTIAHPIFGVGFGGLVPILESKVAASDASSNAQSVYLQVLAEAGFVGGVALLLLVLGLGRDLLAGLRTRRLLSAGATGAVACLLICWVTDYTIRYEAVGVMFAVLFGIVAALGRRPAR